MLTNKKLSDALEIPIYQVRRWVKELLPPDPKATRRSGYTRKYSVNDGFFVFLGGWYVQKYGTIFEDAREVLKILKPWLLKNGLVPEGLKDAKREGIEAEYIIGGPCTAHIYPKDKFSSKLCIGIELWTDIKNEKPRRDELGKLYRKTTYEIATFLINTNESEEKISIRDLAMAKSINIFTLLKTYYIALLGEDEFFRILRHPTASANKSRKKAKK